jgi:hypothetical protein
MGDAREYPLCLEAISTAQKRPFINIQPLVTLFSKGTIIVASLSLFLEHSLAANFTRANHVLYTVPSFRFIAFSLIFALGRGFLFCGLASQNAIGLWGQSGSLYTFDAAITGCSRWSITGAIGSRPNLGSCGL